MAKNKFGLNQIKNPTPMWATWTFRIVFLLTTVAIFVIASDPVIKDATKVRIGVYLQALQMLIFGLSKLVGINVKPEEQQDPESESQV